MAQPTKEGILAEEKKEFKREKQGSRARAGDITGSAMDYDDEIGEIQY